MDGLYEKGFDNLLMTEWKKAENEGVFNYKIAIKCRRVNGPIGFVVQSCTQRIKNRRTPQVFNNVCLDFDENKFHFGKVPLSEILFQISQKVVNNEKHIIFTDSKSYANAESNFAVSNVSPFAIGHMLLVPKLHALRPQILTYDAVELALEIQLLSKKHNFITVFNGMCAQASVNHLHLHCYYLSVEGSGNDLLVQNVEVVDRQLSKNCFVCKSIPVPAYYFEVPDRTKISEVSSDVIKIVNFFASQNIAHNMSIVKGRKCVLSNQAGNLPKSTDEVLKVFLWPRVNQTGAKRDFRVNAGACELSGHLFVTDEIYDTVTESDLLRTVQSVSLSDDVFENLTRKIAGVLNETTS